MNGPSVLPAWNLDNPGLFANPLPASVRIQTREITQAAYWIPVCITWKISLSVQSACLVWVVLWWGFGAKPKPDPLWSLCLTNRPINNLSGRFIQYHGTNKSPVTNQALLLFYQSLYSFAYVTQLVLNGAKQWGFGHEKGVPAWPKH